MRVESDHRLGNGGWLHRLDRDMFNDPVMRPQTPLTPKRTLANIGRTWARFASRTGDPAVARLSTLLGVTSASLRELGVCWAWPHEAWGFPMFDGAEQFAGIRLRSEDGDKWALRGSKQGIFIPGMDLQGEVLVVEGPTDAAAAVSLGFYAIGRPSCTGGAPEIRQFCWRHQVKRLTVLADNDGPGLAGAKQFQKDVGITTRLSVLPAKDLREWVSRGVTRGVVETCLNAGTWKSA